MYTDSHCHLNFPDLHNHLAAVRQAMQEAQVTRALCICTTLEEFSVVHQLAIDYDNFWATAGVHPDNEASETLQEPTIQMLVDLAKLPRVVALGETGLDYFRLEGRTHADMAWQRQRFRNHIQASKITRKPLVIHTRNASEDTLGILQEEQATQGVFHCFTEDIGIAKRVLDLGFYISLSGILTFKTAQALREVAAFVPLDRLLIETDSPYLAPMPHRGKINSPAYVPLVAAQLGQIKNTTCEAIGKQTSLNFNALFNL